MTFRPYPKYKASGVEWLGDIPKGWETKRLKYLGQAITGLTYDPSQVVDETDGTIVLRSSNVQGGRISFDDIVNVRTDIPSELVTRVGDILICSRNGSRALIGKNAVIDERSAGLTFGAFMTIFRSDINAYLYWIFNSQLFKFQSGAFLTSTINQLTIGNLYSFNVPLPPQSDRHAIAAFLDRETAKIDTLISKQEAMIDLLKEKKQSVISHAVTKGIDPSVLMKASGVEWLGDVPEHWSVERLVKVAYLQRGFDLTKDEMVAGLVPVVTSSGINGYHNVAKVSAPGVVTGRYGSTGSFFYIEEDYWPHNTALYVKNFCGNNERFVFHMLSILPFDMFNEKAAVPGINRNDVHGLFVGVPPPNEQERIARNIDAAVKKFDTLIDKAQQAIALQKEHRTALISAAVTGKIDVRHEVDFGKAA